MTDREHVLNRNEFLILYYTASVVWYLKYMQYDACFCGIRFFWAGNHSRVYHSLTRLRRLPSLLALKWLNDDAMSKL